MVSYIYCLNSLPMPPTRDVPDPYYASNFEYVYRLVESGCQGLLAHIRQEEGI